MNWAALTVILGQIMQKLIQDSSDKEFPSVSMVLGKVSSGFCYFGVDFYYFAIVGVQNSKR